MDRTLCGVPYNRSPMNICNHRNAYDDCSLEIIDENYLPRAVYRPGDKEGSDKIFQETVRKISEEQKSLAVSDYRFVALIWSVSATNEP